MTMRAAEMRLEPVRIFIEREARFSPPAGLRLPSFGAVADEPQLGGLTVGETVERRRDSCYYDTADLALADAGITVRRDHVADGYDWRLVITADATSAYPIRRRLHFPGGPRQVPEPLLDYLKRHHRRRSLIPVATVTGVATAVPLLLAGGVRLADVEDECTHARAGTLVTTMRQIAVRTSVLNGVGDAVLARVTAMLLDAGCRLELPAGDLFRFTARDGAPVV